MDFENSGLGQDDKQQEQPPVFKCEICEATFDTNQKLGSHRQHCVKKTISTQETAPKVDSRQPRQKRVPFGEQETRLPAGPSDDGFYYRVFNDNWQKEPGRVARALRAGYQVFDLSPSSGMTVGTNQDGSEIKGVLMRIPAVLKAEDDLAKEMKLMETDKQIYAGRFKKQQGDGRYIPNEGISVSNKLIP